MERRAHDWPCVAIHPEGVTLGLRVQPNASKTRPDGLWRDRLRLRIQAPPVQGKANKAVLRWVAGVFGLSRAKVRLLQGERGRDKVVLLCGLTLDQVLQRLEKLGLPSPDAKSR